MSPLSDTTPKALIEVAGNSLITHALALLEGQIPIKPIVNIHAHADAMVRWAKANDLLISDETDMLRETGGGLRHAMPQLGDGPVLTMNTDAVWTGPSPVPDLVAGWRDRMSARLVVVPHDRAVGHRGHGDFDMDKDGRLTRGTAYIYTGVQLIDTRNLPTVTADSYSMNVYWDAFLADRTIFGCVHTGSWCDVGQPSSIPLAEGMLADAV